ncbi:MAG: MFS transporter [Burkholderiaceae bacterium]|nr:MFS transporter [Burkholderiaceae bacterium]MCX8004223.1 MFS transporter [Burkholderiaceae bacterium]
MTATAWRLAPFYFGYFATAGILAPYFPLYLEWRGLSAAQIGIVMAVAQGMRVVGPTFWGWLADRTAHRERILRATAAAALLAFLPILAPGGFALVLTVMFVYHFFLTGQVPMAEAMAGAHLHRRIDAAAQYGRLRAWGSIGFIALVLATGPLLDRLGVAPTPYLVLALLAFTLAAAWYARDARGGEAQASAVSVRARLREPRVRWFFASALLMVFAHGAMYTYLSLYLAQLGYSKAAIGVFWVLGVVLEIGLFFVQGRLFARFALFTLLEATLLLAALRFLLTAEFADVVPLLALAQMLHAATFALHHSACVLTIQRWFPGRAATRGQALYISVGYGIGGTAGSLAAAGLWSSAGPAATFWSSTLAALAGWVAVRRARRHEGQG